MELFQQQLDKIEALLKKQNALSKEVLTLEEAAEYLQLSKSCLYKMTSNKEISHYVPGGKKIYFRRTELDNWVFNSKVTPSSEFDKEIENYLGRTQKSVL
ncbi:putative excisionase [Flavobacterium psychrophilum]|uniref:helix-turn-helix domain-containing protein n=1 Tax=Flavobacterium psychrophilum TaxID=96345 RepID=UPI000B7C4D9A|nr:helix-turn-helix domain-containing protein [Flavobacterium psychrophilum]SNB12281.1 putative excisionase [Flavobacterium psychrophilum]